MRNHNQKARDMSRSVLPSTTRKSVRLERRRIHKRERAYERELTHELARCADLDNFEGDLGYVHRHEMADLVRHRRSRDKIGPVMRWAERTVERDPNLKQADWATRSAHFRKLLPPGLIGNHAISHLSWKLRDRPFPYFHYSTGRIFGPEYRPEPTIVQCLFAAGFHAELNRRIRAEVLPYETQHRWTPAMHIVDADHPAPGLLIPGHWTLECRARPVRFLLGAHDLDAFGGRSWSVARDLYEELAADPQVSL